MRLSLVTAYHEELTAKGEKGPKFTTQEVPARDLTGSAKMEKRLSRLLLSWPVVA